MYQTVSQFCDFTLNVLLYGNDSLSYEINVDIFEAVHKYSQGNKHF